MLQCLGSQRIRRNWAITAILSLCIHASKHLTLTLLNFQPYFLCQQSLQPSREYPILMLLCLCHLYPPGPHSTPPFKSHPSSKTLPQLSPLAYLHSTQAPPSPTNRGPEHFCSQSLYHRLPMFSASLSAVTETAGTAQRVLP